MSSKQLARTGAAAALVLGVVGLGSAPAFAASAEQCVITPETTKTVHHAAVYKDVATTTPGTDAVTHTEGQFTRTVPAVAAQTYEQWKYSVTVPGLEEKAHKEYQFSREHAGSPAIAHDEYRFYRDVQDKPAKTHQEYRYKKTNKGHGTTLYKDGAWTKNVIGTPWVVIEERTVVDEPATYVREYRAADGSATRKESNAAWFATATFDGWTQYGDSRSVEDSPAVAPYTEYRAADGSAVTNSDDAGWFSKSSFKGWTSFGSKWVTTQEATDDVTLYIVRGDDDTLTTSEDVADATAFTSKPDGLDPNALEFGREAIVSQEAVPEKVLYLTEKSDGSFGESEDPNDAAWISLVGDPVDTSVWSRVTDATTGDELELVVVDQIASSSTTKTTRVLDKAAWDETVKVPAKMGDCASAEGALAKTGADHSAMILAAGGTIVLLGAGVVAVDMYRRKARVSAKD